MSVASKRRFITNKAESEMVIPTEGDLIARVCAARGNNLHEVEDEKGDTYMVSMPPKFRKALWIRRGQFVVIRSIDEGDKVKGEIEHVLDTENVLYIREQKLWPAHFENDAHLLTRGSKRADIENNEHGMIDADMLPPSDSDEYTDEEEEGDDEEDDGESDCETDSEREPIDQFNPNRSKAPEHC